MALIRGGFATHSESTLTITTKGMRRVGRVTETDGERRRRQAAEALAAQREGEWQPAPAGTAAAAERAAADDRRHIAQLIEAINTNREQARFERRMMKLAESWHDLTLAEECRRDAERYEAIATGAESELDELRAKGAGGIELCQLVARNGVIYKIKSTGHSAADRSSIRFAQHHGTCPDGSQVIEEGLDR
jgi:hypothetical protein